MSSPLPHPVAGNTGPGQEKCFVLALFLVLSTSHCLFEIAPLLYRKARSPSALGLAFLCFSSSPRHRPDSVARKRSYSILYSSLFKPESQVTQKICDMLPANLQHLEENVFQSLTCPDELKLFPPRLVILPWPGDIQINVVLQSVARTASKHSTPS